MADVLIASLFGFLGGAMRAAVGLSKVNNLKKNFNLMYLVVTLLLATVIGTAVAFAYTTNNIFYLAIGYAGTDFLQGLAKARAK